MGKKILLADDSITIQKVIELTFSDEDFDVVTVGNGRLAIEKAQEIRPDIVLCDIIMPEKDGYEVCEFIKKAPGLQGIPVLLLTGAFEPFDQERAARVGSDGFLAKPFEPETLIAKVKDLLSRVAARPPASSAPPSRPATGASPAIPFVPPPREGEPTRATPTPTPPLTVVPRPSEPIPFPRVAPPPEPPKAPPAMAPPAPSVSFIPEEPFEDLDAGSFLADDDPAAARPQEPIPFRSAADELLPMTPEESESLGVPDSASTVMFKAEQVSWQPPVPSAPPAAPPPAAAAPPAHEPELASEPVFEEVIEEEEFGGVYSPPPVYAEPAARFEPPAPPVVEAPRPPAIEPETVEIASSVPIVSPAPSRPPASKPPASKPPASRPTAPAPPSSAPPAFARPEPPPPTMPTVAVAPPWLAHSSREPEAVFEAEPEPVSAPAPSAPPAAPPVAPVSALPAEVHAAPVAWVATPAPPPPPPGPSPESFADLVTAAPAAEESPRPSEAAGVAVPVEMVEKIAQRVVAQISEKVVREIAWDVIPDLAEALIKAEIERLKAELQRI